MKDRRIKKTEEAIQTAFSKLLSEMSMDDITVKKLCEIADINKSTFYLHYNGLYDCADCLRNNIINEIHAVFAPYDFNGIIDNFSVILISIMRIFEKNREIYMPFLKSPSLAPSTCKMRELLIEKILQGLKIKNEPDMTYCCTISFLIGGLISLLEQHDFAEISPKITSTIANKIKNGFAN